MSDLTGGVMPASITPLTDQGAMDLPGLARLIARFRSHGCVGVVLAGTNGEGASLSAFEKRDLVKAAVPIAAELPIVLGVATASIEEAIWSCESARKEGASAALVMPPGFFRDATEEGVARWYEKLLRATLLPILVYNFPKRTGFTFRPELVERLCRHDGVIGFKDSSGEAANIASFPQAAAGKKLYVGDETLLADALSAGWTGTISGAANVLSRWLAPIVAEWPSDRESAETKFAYIRPFLEALRTSPQPVANKWVLHRVGALETPLPRLPLLPLEAEVGEALWEKIRVVATG